MEIIRPEDIGRLIRGRMGVIVGPGLSQCPGVFSDLSRHLSQVFGVEQGANYLKTADAALAKGVKEGDIREQIRSFIDKQPPSALLSHLCKAKWAAAFSASLDTYFEERLRQEYDRRLAGKTVTIISDLATLLPPRSIPIYKLLGIASRAEYAYSTATYVRRRIAWRGCTKTFADCVKGNPVLCLGMSDCPDVLYDLVAELAGNPSCAPRALLFLADDPLGQNQQVQQIVGSVCSIVQVRGTIGDVVRAADAEEQAGYAPTLPYGSDDERPFASLRPYSELTVVVNEHLQTTTTATETALLHDILFSPSVARWEPFVYGLDFRRSATQLLYDELKRLMAEKGIGDGAFVLRGSSAAGKTTVLKRIAFNAAQAGFLTLWFKPWFYQDTHRALNDFFVAIKKLKTSNRHGPVVIFMDDPLGHNSFSAREVVASARVTGVEVFLVLGVRNTDWLTQDCKEITGYLPVFLEQELSDSLDDDEWSALPRYLTLLGVAKSETDAQVTLRGLESKHARDTLSMLYWLLPATKAHIASSIRDEFYRLGDMAGLTRLIVGAATHTTQLLKRAYEMVAVADRFGAPLPIEVLVSALGVQYDEWLQAAGPEGPAWGLLYAEESAEHDTWLYRTRNSIVTNTIVEAVNGGSLGHSGELRVMSEVLQACKGSQPVYREFCVRVLVPNRKIDRLDYADGLRLYQDALSSLPYPDKTLVHHKGLWIKNKGKNPVEADEVLRAALDTRVYPYADRGEIDQHIHTSRAATGLDAIDQGKLSLEQGKLRVLEHLEKARAEGFLNVHAVHVQANLMLRLADKFQKEQSPDSCDLLNRALADLNRAIQLITSPVANARDRSDDASMLQSVRDEILRKVKPADQLRDEAVRMWGDFRSQQGFVLAAWQAFQRAVNTNRGRDFNDAFTYYRGCVNTITEANGDPIAPLLEIGLYVYFEWQVRRRVMSGGGDPIDWRFLHDTSAAALRSRMLADDVFCRYVHALALAHLGSWPEAKAILRAFRDARLPRHLLWIPRDYLLYTGGGMRQVQGVMKYGPSGPFVLVEELRADFPASREGHWPRQGEVVHPYLRFSLGGVIAVDHP